MSIFFEAGDVDLWNPSNNVGRLFVHQARVFEAMLDTRSGVSDVSSDTVQIEPKAFAEFVESLVQLHDNSNHDVYRNLMRGFIGTALVLASRAGAALDAHGSSDGELADLAAALDKSMPQ